MYNNKSFQKSDWKKLNATVSYGSKYIVPGVVYNMDKNRIEMHLTSLCDQSIAIRELGKQFTFRKGERIHTENSYKFSIDQINSLATQSGLTVLKNYIDDDNLYCLTHLGYVFSTPKTGK